MKVAVFSTKSYDREFLSAANQDQHELIFLEARLNPSTCILAQECPAVCVFVNDELHEETIARLAGLGVKLIALRCAGFNNVDLSAADKYGMTILRVPAYSPYAVAEHTVGLILALNRRMYRAYNRVREGNFSLEGLLGFDLHGKTVGIIGTGKIGAIVAKILQGFGCKLVGYDVFQNPECLQLGMEYLSLDELLAQSDIISLHCPLMPQTYHLINEQTIAKMKQGVMLINTSRGALIDTQALVEGLKSEKIGHLALDVYEQEADLFFEDLSTEVIKDDVFVRLLTFPNVLITGHQAFFTNEAVENIAQTTIKNISDFAGGTIQSQNVVSLEKMRV